MVRTFSGRFFNALVLVLALMIAVPWAAFADATVIDGDGADGASTSNSKNSKFVLCEGVGSSVDVYATVNYSGSGKGAKHFANNGTVTITTSVLTAAQGFITAAGGLVVTANWDENSASVTSEKMKLTVDTDWLEGTYEVTYTFTGKDQFGNDLIINDKNNVQIDPATTGCSTSGGGDTGTTPPPANTAPVVDVTGVEHGEVYEIGSVPTAGCSVVDAEDTGESATPVVSAISGALSPYGLGSVTVTCSYTDAGNLTGTDTETYTIVDTGKPVISDLGATTLPNANHWYNTPVTNTFRASDTGAGFQTEKPKLLSYDFTKSSPARGEAGAEGSAVKINSGSVSDVAGNVAVAIDSAAFQIDMTAPVLNVSGAASGAVNICDGTPSSPSFNPSDALSGLDGSQSDSWTTPTTASGVGTYTYNAQARDFASNSSSETRTYTSTYGGAFGGILQPINADGTSRFKLGSTVPVKFKLMCGTTPVTNAVAKLNVKQYNGTPDPGVDEAISTAASTTGNLFRYDSTSQQYIFNLSTKSGYTNPNGTTVSFAPGTWTLSVLLDDGTYRSVNISIVK